MICMDDKYFRCDTKNIGLTMLCKFDGDVPLPAIWSHQVIIINSANLAHSLLTSKANAFNKKINSKQKS